MDWILGRLTFDTVLYVAFSGFGNWAGGKLGELWFKEKGGAAGATIGAVLGWVIADYLLFNMYAARGLQQP